MWSMGIRNVPKRVRVRLERRRDEDEEASEKVSLSRFVKCFCKFIACNKTITCLKYLYACCFVFEHFLISFFQFAVIHSGQACSGVRFQGSADGGCERIIEKLYIFPFCAL